MKNAWVRAGAVVACALVAGCGGAATHDEGIPIVDGVDGKSDASAAVCSALGTFAASESLTLGDRTVRVDRERARLQIESPRGTIELGPVYVELDGRLFVASAIEDAARDSRGIALAYRVANHRATGHLRVVADGDGDGVVDFAITNWGGIGPVRAGLILPSDGSEHFFGFGEKLNTFDQAGRVVDVRTSDHAASKGDHSYKAAPWFLSSRGYGVWFDSTFASRFDLRASHPSCVRIEHRDMALPFRLFEGPTMQDALSRFTRAVGRPTPLPAWAYGPWISSDVWRSGGEVRWVVEKHRALGLPASVFVFDSPWATAYNDFRFNQAQFAAGGDFDGVHWDGFATPSELFAFFRERDLKVVLWMTPFINIASNDEGITGQNLGRASTYDEAAQKGYFIRDPFGAPLVIDWWKGRGSLLDFTNPAAVAWLRAQLVALQDESGGVIAGWKTDAGESDYIPDEARFFDGNTGITAKNRYPLDYQRAVASAFPPGEGVLFARSGAVGAQQFPAHWPGDNEANFGADNGLPSVIVAAQSAAMSGYVYWGSDIGGYLDSNPSSTPDNLFMRWTQFAAMTPIFAMHRQIARGKQYPWSYGDAALDNYRQYALLHTALTPYFAALAEEAFATGKPIVRPLALVNGSDARSYSVQHTFLVGESLLVAPMLTNHQTERTVLLPSGRWLDFANDDVFVGGNDVTWRSPDQSRLPLFVRGGAIVPLQELADRLTIVVVPDEQATQLRLDDGTTVTQRRDGTEVAITVKGAARPLTVELRGIARPSAITVAGELLDDGEWAYESGRLRFDLDHTSSSQVVIEVP